MREQEEMKQQAEEDRRARKELMTGGGFDLSKLRAKNEKVEVSEKAIDPMQKST
jgi:Spy/CpxP family protein refolding chaperone